MRVSDKKQEIMKVLIIADLFGSIVVFRDMNVVEHD